MFRDLSDFGMNCWVGEEDAAGVYDMFPLFKSFHGSPSAKIRHDEMTRVSE